MGERSLLGLGRALSLALALASCKEKPPPPPIEPAASAAPEPVFSARRPSRHYYLARTAATRCELYFADPGSFSQPQPVTCPLILEVGERIRTAGKTCVREGGSPDRVEPVVCPNPLLDFEKHDRAGGGAQPVSSATTAADGG